MTHHQYEDPDDRDLLPPQLPMDPVSRVIRALNDRFPKLYAALSLAPRLAISLFWLRKLERDGLGRRLSSLEFSDLADSTIFVFGTGASINDYPEEWWSVIRNHHSVGMNFFLLHEHVPTYHVMEDVHGIRAQLLRYRYLERGDYRAVPLIVKTQLTNLSTRRVKERIEELEALPASIREQTYLSLDFLAAGRTVLEMEESYQRLAAWGLWKPKRRFLVLTKRRGSVSYVINLAVRAGYRRIVLCGIDLNHTEYFYDSRRGEFERSELPVPINDEVGPVHSTNDPDQDPVTIHDVILAIKNGILDPMGIELMVGSRSSALYPELAQFDWATAAADVAEFGSGDGTGEE
jgi:hypothetical protein